MKCLSLPVSVILLLAGLAFAHESNHRGNRSICGLSSVWSYDTDEETQKKMAQSQKREDSFVKYAKKFYPRAKTRLNTVQDASQNAPVFGSIVKKKILDKDIEDVFPEYSESFAKWCNDKKQEYKANVAKASLETQETFEDYNEISTGFGSQCFLLHMVIDVKQKYDVETKKWIAPPPEEKRKTFFKFLYRGASAEIDSAKSDSAVALFEKDFFLPGPTGNRIFFDDGWTPVLTKKELLSVSDSFGDSLAFVPFQVGGPLPINKNLSLKKKILTHLENGEFDSIPPLIDESMHYADTVHFLLYRQLYSEKEYYGLSFLTRRFDMILNRDRSRYYRPETVVMHRPLSKIDKWIYENLDKHIDQTRLDSALIIANYSRRADYIIREQYERFKERHLPNRSGVVRYVRDSDVKAVEYEVKLPKNKR